MWKITVGLLIFFLSSLVFAQTTNNGQEAQEVTIPGYSPPKTESTASQPPATGQTAVQEELPTVPTQPPMGTSPPVPGIDPNVVKQWQDLFAKIATCTPGVYVMKQINPATASMYTDTQTVKIIGQQDRTCHLTIMFYAESDEKAPGGKRLGGADCKWDFNAVGSYIDFNSRILKKQTTVQVYPLIDALAKECMMYEIKDGKKVPQPTPTIP